MFKSTILVVDDNPDILYNLNLTLKLNEYNVITAEDGIKAIDALKECEVTPNLIISDIIMPEMDGYGFFKKVSENTDWYHIPFIFLTAKATPDDIRIGKFLGVDDYITKPFKEENLLAIITEKLAREKRIEAISTRIDELGLRVKNSEACTSCEKIFLMLVNWDEIQGPSIKDFFPKEKADFSIEKTAVQLFQVSDSIYGHEDYSKSADLLLRIKDLQMDAYLYFDMIQNNSVRGGKNQFMIATLAPSMSVFQSLKLRKIQKKFASKIRSEQDWNIEKYWSFASTILTC